MSQKHRPHTVPAQEHEETLVACAYNSSHRVRPGSRLQLHLLKCRKEHLKNATLPGHRDALNIDICKFDATHHVHRDKMEEHLKTCSGSNIAQMEANDVDSILARVSLTVGKGDAAKAKNTASTSATPAPAGENWDEEWGSESADGASAVGPYDPMAKVHAAKGAILFNPQNRTKSEKRLFRQQQRLAASDGGAPGPQGTFREDIPGLAASDRGGPPGLQGTIREDASAGWGRERGRGRQSWTDPASPPSQSVWSNRAAGPLSAAPDSAEGDKEDWPALGQGSSRAGGRKGKK